jgi:hemoglobin
MHPQLLTKMNARAFALSALALAALAGCGGGPAQKAKNQDFFTSGSTAADQRASERMAQNEQLTGSGQGAGEKDVKNAKVAKASAGGESDGATNKAAQAEGKLALYDRLGAEAGLTKIVADFLPRAMQDPRVNWNRLGVTHGGFSIHHAESQTWTNSPANVRLLQRHCIEFLALATGGPAHYEGKELKSTHAEMHISNPEFDATIGDLKVTLDRLQIPNKEQKELLAIVESTRPEIVTEH